MTFSHLPFRSIKGVGAAVTGVVLFVGVQWGCMTGPGDLSEPPRVATARRAIINGTPDTLAAHQAVVAVTRGGALCSGTLITNRVVLTAGHCVAGAPAGAFTVYFGNSTSNPTATRSVQATAVHPAYDPGNGPTDPPRNDVALLRLSSNAPSGVAPIPILPVNLGIGANDVDPNPINVVFVGFGQDENAQSGTKLTITLPLAAVCFGPEDCFFSEGNAAGWAVGKSLGYIITPGGPCSGDSGGPGLVNRFNVEYVASVNSYGDQNCAESNVGAMVQAYTTFIMNFVNGTNNEVCEGNVDEDGDNQTDCADPDCSSDTACIGPQWLTADEICDNQTHSCSDGSACLSATFIPNWPAGAGICSPTCSQLGMPNEECLEGVNGLGICGVTSGNDDHCILYCGSVLGEGCPTGFTCRDWDTGAPNPQQGACVPNFPPSESNCIDNIDDDGDGQTDCDDPDCAGRPQCVPGEVCDNNIDDDADGATDCDDMDCAGHVACSLQENCFNGVDDDDDGAVDCDDPDCASAQGCGVPEDCTNRIDDDNDGYVDCADPDCAGHVMCGGNENCFDGVDDDGDGMTDCEDPECYQSQNCVPDEICTNDRDDDLDGYTDCDDPDCSVSAICRGGLQPEDEGCACSVARAAARGRGSPGWFIPLLLLFLAGLFFTARRVRRTRGFRRRRSR